MNYFYRISKSDPVLKYSTTHSTLKNAHDNSQLIANECLDTQKILEKLRKVPKARVLSWAESFDNLLSDKGNKLINHFNQVASFLILTKFLLVPHMEILPPA